MRKKDKHRRQEKLPEVYINIWKTEIEKRQQDKRDSIRKKKTLDQKLTEMKRGKKKDTERETTKHQKRDTE